MMQLPEPKDEAQPRCLVGFINLGWRVAYMISQGKRDPELSRAPFSLTPAVRPYTTQPLQTPLRHL